MPPKGKDAKKGAVQGNYKAGKPLKDILPPNTKPPREGVIAKQEGEPEVDRKFEYEPLPHFPEWPGNEQALGHDFSVGKTEEGDEKQYEDNAKIHLPPSFAEFQRDTNIWCRPGEYITEILHEKAINELKAEKRRQSKTRKNVRKQAMLAMGEQPDISMEDKALLDKEIVLSVSKDALPVRPCVIASMERLETEEEIKKRKEEAETRAAADKGSKKKAAPAKGGAAHDPSDDPQMLQIPIENSLDLGFSMPIYTKWVTSQFQLTKDRYMRDVVSKEKIWERIYPQLNGAPVVSPSGKYWIKVRFDGKERLIEIDDRVPCDYKGRPIFARTNNTNEIWPQLLMKALLKVYSYKWYSPDAQFDQEIGDGSIIYSLTGLIPENISVKNFSSETMALFRKMLNDEWYFGHKSYITCYCDEGFRPKLPSQLQSNLEKTPERPRTNDDYADIDPAPAYDSSKKMLQKLKSSASMAITVTTGRKLVVRKNPNASNVIPGFGYAMMDIFENEFVDMNSIVKAKDRIEEDKSPFKSPSKRLGSPSRPRDSSITKEEYRRQRKEERQRILEEFDRREKMPPTQFSLINIKTAVARYPTINYVSPFSNDEIYEGKRCYLNHWRRTPEAELARQLLIERTASPKKRMTQTARFSLNIQGTQQDLDTSKVTVQEEKKDSTFEDANSNDELKQDIKPRTRAPGGVWIRADDFEYAFTDLIVYHNLSSFQHTELYQDSWSEQSQPFIANEKDIYIKLSIDDDLFKKFKEDNGIDSATTIEQVFNKTGQQEARESWAQDEGLPGEKKALQETPDQLLLAFQSYPTSKPYNVLPRYSARFTGVNCKLDVALQRYLESISCQLSKELTLSETLWIKPNLIAPLGQSIWVATNLRKIEFVTRQEYLVSQKSFFQKQYNCDFLPLTANRLHLFGKYEFKVADEETLINVKVGCVSDKFLLEYVRLKIINKDVCPNQWREHKVFNHMDIQNLKLTPNENGYILLLEGNMPYNTQEGQLQIEVLSNQESFALEEIVGTEPLEYTDQYKPWKYGIIFKEKILYHPADNILTTINLRLLKDGKDFRDHSNLRSGFRLELLDNGVPVISQMGWNQMSWSHFLLRANQGLPESTEDTSAEVKHNYVLQATFDLSTQPEFATANEHTENITWSLKIFSSDTVSLIKDTDKEDREKALKGSWEAAEPGRAEKASKSRQRFLLNQKQAAGEELNEEELEVLKEKRERIRKKDMEEVVQDKKGKKAPPPKKDDKKGAKQAATAAAEPEEDVAPKMVLPEPEDHINENIVQFLQHYKSNRLIHVSCEDPDKLGRKRSDEEKARLLEEAKKQRENEQKEHEEVLQSRDQQRVLREKFKTKHAEQIGAERESFKGQLSKTVEQRNSYRDMIIKRNQSKDALEGMLSLEKIDVNQLQTAIDGAIEMRVRQDVIQRASKQLKWLKYCKEVEGLLQQAVQEKNKENISGVLERIEREGITIDAKMLNDSKNLLSKLK